MRPTYAETLMAPHAIYRLFDKDENLLYLGCSVIPFRRLQHHLYMQPWHLDITKITLEWHHDWLTGRRAEMAAIQIEQPKYNKLVHDPDAVGTKNAPAKPRGDGLHCPKCGAEKASRRNAYCASCQTTYQRERRIKAGWVPHVREPLTCPRCEGPRVEGKSYCAQCKSLMNKEGRLRRKAAAEAGRLTLS